MSKVKDSFIYLFILLLIIADVGYSYQQYALTQLDGDLVAIVAPSEGYSRVLQDPFGWSAFINNESYPATNRFMAHATLSAYYRTVPFLLQSFVSPIESIYMASALAKILLHISIIGLIGWFISGLFNFGWKETVLGAALISPLLQTAREYFEYMGVIDQSITYAMFYVLPAICVLLVIVPFYKSALSNYATIPLWVKPILILSIILLVFFGALPAPILIIASTITLLVLWWNNFQSITTSSFIQRTLNSIKKINIQLLLFFIFTILACLYSIYVGTKNSENGWTPLTLLERYSRLMHGIVDCFFKLDTGLLYVLIAIAINTILLNLFYKKASAAFFKISLFLTVFSILYILLLPMGGYRAYRPFILRRDTLVPVLMILYYCWGASSILLLKFFTGKWKLLFICFLCYICFIYEKADVLPDYTNVCEKTELAILASKTEDCVTLDRNCSIVNWAFVYVDKCEQSSSTASMLFYWNITPRKIEFRHAPEVKK